MSLSFKANRKKTLRVTLGDRHSGSENVHCLEVLENLQVLEILEPRANSRDSRKFHWEIKGRFRKRVVLANVPSFRFRFGGTCARTLVQVFVPGEHPNVPSFRFSKKNTFWK